MAYILVLALIIIVMVAIWYSLGSSTDVEKVRARATKLLGDVMIADEYCASHDLTMVQLQQKIDASEIRTYSSGKFLFVQTQESQST